MLLPKYQPGHIHGHCHVRVHQGQRLVGYSCRTSEAVLRAQALAVPMVYGILEALLVGLYGWYAWKAGWTKAPTNASACIVWTASYELETNASIEKQGEETHASFEIASRSSLDDNTADTTVADEDLLEEIDLVVASSLQYGLLITTGSSSKQGL
jgi:hypothetical protein